jgi:hypothetical protein
VNYDIITLHRTATRGVWVYKAATDAPATYLKRVVTAEPVYEITRGTLATQAPEDSSAPIGRAEAVYMRARVSVVRPEELPDRAAFYCGRYPETRAFVAELLRPDSPFSLYRAAVSEHSVLVRGSDPTYGTGVDSRAQVVLD